MDEAPGVGSTGTWSRDMHPFVLYLAAVDIERNHRPPQRKRSQHVRAAATPSRDPARVSRLGRLTAIVRRSVERTAGT